MARQWYVVHTYSGYENKVKANIERRVESMGMNEKVFRVIVPTQEQIEVKDGKKRLVSKKVFPGYVIVEIDLDDDSWYLVRNTPGVTGFVGSGSKPVSLREEEVDHILVQMGLEEPKHKVDFGTGDRVRVVRGPFENFSGVIRDVNLDRGKARVLLSVFGRETPVELSFTQLQKL